MSSKDQSIVESMTSWYGLNFRSARVPDLPRRLSLGSDSPDLYELDYAGEADEKVCWKLIHSCRERGDNVAVNQLDTEEKLRFQLRFSVSFTIRKAKNPRSKSDHVKEQNVEKDVNHGEYLNALIVINPSIYARTVDTCLAHIHIYRSETLSRDQSVYDDLLSLALTLIPQLDLGYTRCIANVAAGLSNLVESHRRAGFLVVATIPRGIKLVGLGSSDDLVMVKPIFYGHRPRRSSEDIALLCKLYAEEASDVIESLSGADGMLRAPFLPRPYVFENGLEVIVRNVKFSESEIAYDVWKTAAGKGQGYGLDECPTLEMFQLIMMTDHYCIAFDDAQTSQLVGLTFISDSWYHRNPDLKYGETSLFLTEPYRGRGTGPEATHLGLLLLKQLGYTATLNDTLLSNSQMFKALKRSPLPPLAVGVIPDSTYTAGRGWDDQVILLADYSESNLVQGFVEASENSLKRKYTSSKL